MNTKNNQNPVARIKKTFTRPTPAARPFDVARELRILLSSIDLQDPDNRLSAEKIRELNIPGVFEYAMRELRCPPDVNFDLTELSSNIKFIIHTLRIALREGLEETAEWACCALVFAVKSLLTDSGGMDPQFADALWKLRVEYSGNLKHLVQTSMEKDHAAMDLKEMLKRRLNISDDLEQRRNLYLARKDAGALDHMLAELEIHAANPAVLSEDAAQLRAELNEMHMLEKSLAEIDPVIDSMEHHLSCIDREIEHLRMRLTSPPRFSSSGPDGSSPVNEERRRLIAYHSHPEALSFDELTDIDHL